MRSLRRNLKYLRFEHLKEKGLYNNRTTLDRHIKAGLFPAPVRLGPNSVAWVEEEVEAVEEARLAARREAA